MHKYINKNQCKMPEICDKCIGDNFIAHIILSCYWNKDHIFVPVFQRIHFFSRKLSSECWEAYK